MSLRYLQQKYPEKWGNAVIIDHRTTKPKESTKKLLRSLPMARQCKYLGERLTREEVEARQLMGCRTCNNVVPAFHCNLPNAKKFNDGPYARPAGECMNCTDWQPKPHENPSLPEGISWEPIRFDHTNLHPGVIPGVRFNSSMIESMNELSVRIS